MSATVHPIKRRPLRRRELERELGYGRSTIDPIESCRNRDPLGHDGNAEARIYSTQASALIDFAANIASSKEGER